MKSLLEGLQGLPTNNGNGGGEEEYHNATKVVDSCLQVSVLRERSLSGRSVHVTSCLYSSQQVRSLLVSLRG